MHQPGVLLDNEQKSNLQEMLEIFPSYNDQDLKDSKVFICATIIIIMLFYQFKLQGAYVIWPVDVLFVPEKSIAMVRHYNEALVSQIPLTMSEAQSKLSFSTSRLDRIQRPFRKPQLDVQARAPRAIKLRPGVATRMIGRVGKV